MGEAEKQQIGPSGEVMVGEWPAVLIDQLERRRDCRRKAELLGKMTAALGMALRCIGHGLKVAVVQFIKGAIDTAEERALKSFGGRVTFLRTGEGYTWETQDRERDTKFAQQAWGTVCGLLQDPSYAMVILDEFNIALQHDYVRLEDVLPALRGRPPMQHVVITGRGAKEALIEEADLVTEMKQVKHPFRKGVKAQQGVEF